MIFRREPPQPPQSDPPSVLLLRAIGDREGEGISVFDLDILASEMGMRAAEVMLVIRHGIDAGFVVDDPGGALTLTKKGRRWYAKDLERRW